MQIILVLRIYAGSKKIRLVRKIRGLFSAPVKPQVHDTKRFQLHDSVLNPYAFLVVSFALLLKPSTIPLENCPLARNQFNSNGRCFRNLRATFFMGSILERIVFVHHLSRNCPAQ